MMNKKIEIHRQETGRSMTEMLGVLAVIGILSIGGILGYRSAMDKSKANDIIDGVSKRAMILSQKAMLGQTITTTSLDADFGSDRKIAGFTYEVAGTENGYKMTLADIDEGVCDKLMDQGLKSASVIKLGTSTIWENEEKADYSCEDTNTVVYEFANDLNTTGDSDAEEEAEESQCTGEKPGVCSKCVSGAWVDDNDECGDDQVCSNGSCVSSNQCSGKTWGDCEECDTSTGSITNKSSGDSCTITDGTIEKDGLCNGSGTCVAKTCEGFTSTTCTTGCYYVNNTQTYDYTTSSCTVTDGTIEKDGLCNGLGTCVAKTCEGFTSTTCRTGCYYVNSMQTYSDASYNTPCDLTGTNDGICNGSGTCVTKPSCPNGYTFYTDTSSTTCCCDSTMQECTSFSANMECTAVRPGSESTCCTEWYYATGAGQSTCPHSIVNTLCCDASYHAHYWDSSTQKWVDMGYNSDCVGEDEEEETGSCPGTYKSYVDDTQTMECCCNSEGYEIHQTSGGTWSDGVESSCCASGTTTDYSTCPYEVYLYYGTKYCCDSANYQWVYNGSGWIQYYNYMAATSMSMTDACTFAKGSGTKVSS